MPALSTSLKNTALRVATLGAMLAFLSGCATQSPPHALSVITQSCGAKQVRYCVESGSRAEDGVCRCLSQDAAQSSLENL